MSFVDTDIAREAMISSLPVCPQACRNGRIGRLAAASYNDPMPTLFSGSAVRHPLPVAGSGAMEPAVAPRCR